MRQRFLFLTFIMMVAVCVSISGCSSNAKKVRGDEVYEQSSSQPTAKSLSEQVSEHLKTLTKSNSTTLNSVAGIRTSSTSRLVTHFYERRNYRPAWIDDNGILLPQVDTLIKKIQEAGHEGLKPHDYHLTEINAELIEKYHNQIIQNPPNPVNLAKLDILLTDSFLLYSSHLLNGRINPQAVGVEWLIDHQEPDLIAVLQTALNFNQIEENLNILLPQHPGYERLRHALQQYKEIASKGGWPTVPAGTKMQKGSQGERVAALRARLIASGDLIEEPDENKNIFDGTLERAVRNFQRRHGLSVDGTVGPATLAELNVPVEQRIRQIEFNMERWRWLPQNLGQRYIMVNIANFELYAVENEQTWMTMRVVVGKPYWYTPMFSAEMTHLVLNPSWNIPDTIVLEEVASKIQEDPEYLSKQNIKVLQSWKGSAAEIDPKLVDWSKITEQNFKYKLRQQPGPLNPLGQIKFMFPNPFNVYLHDTPFQHYFRRTKRIFSHGCIRVEKPIELAEYVLQQDPRWTREKIRATMKKGITQNVNLSEPVPVYLLYFTAWVDEDGTVQFRDDIYERDKALDEALRGVLVAF
ncbi:MAG TPA: L,D-transpeptidase family protein [Thermodesulfobacteriota bacterium]|nr:L,D-transpeptidase family protein [Thermodesulfobacteriota bacterium]